jgi:hypothetical protein
LKFFFDLVLLKVSGKSTLRSSINRLKAGFRKIKMESKENSPLMEQNIQTVFGKIREDHAGQVKGFR